MFTRNKRAQSAMEYLMTYGWAILIIAVVLGVLFSLGIFSGSNLLGTSCIAYAGYYCASPIMTYNAQNYAQLTVSLGQNTGSAFGTATGGGIIAECGNQTSTPASTGAGWATAPTVGVLSNNLVAAPISLTTWSSGQISSVTMTCAGAGALGTSPTVGTSFTGFIWAVYGSSGANVIIKLASVSVKVS